MQRHRGVEVRVVSTFEDFMELRREWNDLLALSETDRVFLRHEWFAAWWRAFGAGKDIFVIIAEGDDGICAIAPLMRCHGSFRGVPVRSVEFISNNDSPACGFILRRNHEYAAGDIMSFLMGGAPEWDMLFLRNMVHADAVSSEIMKALDSAGRRYIVRPGLSSPYLAMDKDWDEYFKGLSSKSRKTIRNVCNRIRRLGDVEVRECGDVEGFDDMVPVSEKGWKYREGKSFVNRPDRLRFFRLLSDTAASKGWLSIWYVYMNGDPIAYEYHLKYKGMDTALLSEFNSDYGRFSPGTYLDYEIIKSLFANGIREYDMCGVLDEYKKKWTDSVRDYKNLMVFNDTPYSKFLYFIEDKPVRLIRRFRDKV